MDQSTVAAQPITPQGLQSRARGLARVAAVEAARAGLHTEPVTVDVHISSRLPAHVPLEVSQGTLCWACDAPSASDALDVLAELAGDAAEACAERALVSGMHAAEIRIRVATVEPPERVVTVVECL